MTSEAPWEWPGSPVLFILLPSRKLQEGNLLLLRPFAPALPSLIGSWLASSLSGAGIRSLQRGCLLIREVSGSAGGLHVCDPDSIQGRVRWVLCTERWSVPAQRERVAAGSQPECP